MSVAAALLLRYDLPMPKRVSFIRHRGVEILHINWSGAQPAELLAAMADARQIIAARQRARFAR